MPKSNGSSLLVSGLLAGLLLAAAPSARAALFVGAFDPPYGPDFPTLGFRGTGTFFVPDACLALTGTISNSDPCAGGAMTVTSAVVDFYNVPPPTGGPTIASHTFVPPVQSLTEIIVAAGNLIQVETDLIGPQAVSIPGIYSGNMWLRFLDGNEDDGTAAPGAYLYACAPSAPSCESPQSVSNPAAIIFSRVPEPSGIALVIAALAAAGYARRRGGRALNR